MHSRTSTCFFKYTDIAVAGFLKLLSVCKCTNVINVIQGNRTLYYWVLLNSALLVVGKGINVSVCRMALYLKKLIKLTLFGARFSY